MQIQSTESTHSKATSTIMNDKATAYKDREHKQLNSKQSYRKQNTYRDRKLQAETKECNTTKSMSTKHQKRNPATKQPRSHENSCVERIKTKYKVNGQRQSHRATTTSKGSNIYNFKRQKETSKRQNKVTTPTRSQIKQGQKTMNCNN
jgi:hypothetical protein